jgi:hypothetical protein
MMFLVKQLVTSKGLKRDVARKERISPNIIIDIFEGKGGAWKRRIKVRSEGEKSNKEREKGKRRKVLLGMRPYYEAISKEMTVSI